MLMLGNLMPSIQIQVIERLRNRPKLIVMDTMNFWMEIAMDDLKRAIGMVDVLTINDAEARQLTEEYSLVKAARKILKMGPKYLIIKKGEHGALLFHENQVFFAPALPLEEVFDPTGAGDTFAGGFIGYLSSVNNISFDSMKRAVIYGSAMASFCVEKFGLERIENLTEQEVENRIRGLDTTGVPLPFECYYAAEVADLHSVEKKLHMAFMDKRVRDSREFFYVDPAQAKAALSLAELKDVTPKKAIYTDLEDKEACVCVVVTSNDDDAFVEH
jgi:hypothetical protein